MRTWVAIEPLSVSAEPGGESDVWLRIRNTIDVAEEYHVDVVGEPARWCTAEPATLRLYPGTAGTVCLTFAPPRGPAPAAGPYPYGVRVQPVEVPDTVTVTEATVSVAPFADVRAELVPVIVKGWRRAQPRLAVDNYGNTPVMASMRAAVQDQSIDFETRTPGFQVPPGRAHFGVLTIRPNRLLWFGRQVRHPYTATVTPSGSEPKPVSGTYIQTTLLPSWLARLFVALLALIVALVALWLSFAPKAVTQARRSSQASPAAQVSSAPTSQADDEAGFAR